MRNGKVKINNASFDVRIAETLAEKTRGLIGTEYLHDNHGMLFVFPFESVYPFTMKRMSFGLDILWINRHEEIVYIAENMAPCHKFFCSPIMPFKMAKYVLELNAGTTKKLGIKIGDKAEIYL